MNSPFSSATFWIPGTPKGQGRPDVTVKVRYKLRDPVTGGFATDPVTGEHVWQWRHLDYPIVQSDPESHKEAMRIRKIARKVMARLGLEPLPGPIFLGMTSVFVAPASWSKVRVASTVWHTDKPDASNVVKLVEDAANTQQRRGRWKTATEEELRGVLWVDDAQVACQSARKVYGAKEGSLVTVAQLDPCSMSLRPEDCQGVSWPVTAAVAEVIGAQEQMRLDCVGGAT